MDKFAFFTLLLLLPWTVLLSQGPPIFTDTPIMLGLEGGGMRTFGKYVKKENTKIYIQPIALPFNLRANWQIGTILPLTGKWPGNAQGQFGLGDVKIFTKYQLHSWNGKGKTFRTLIKLTQSFPSGAPPLGSGNWTTSLGLVSGLINLKYGLYANLNYQRSSGPNPDKLTYNLALAYPLLPQQYPPKQLNVYLEFNGSYVSRLQQNIYFLSPGFQWIQGRKFLIETGLQIPLREDVEENAHTRFAFLLGLRALLF